MTEKVRYVSLSNVSRKKQEYEKYYNNVIGFLANIIAEEIEKNDGFVKLAYNAGKERKVFYYNSRIAGILGDLSRQEALETVKLNGRKDTETILSDNRNKAKRVGHLAAGVMCENEYNTVFHHDRLEEVCRKFGWQELYKFTYILIDSWGGTLYGGKKNMFDPAYLIPVHRCGEDMGITADSSPVQLAVGLFRYGFLPWLQDGEMKRRLESPSLLNGLLDYIKERGDEAGWDGEEDDERLNLIVVKEEDGKDGDLKKIKKHFQGLCNVSACLPNLDETIFQMESGSWDLWRFVGLRKEELRASDGPWYDVSRVPGGLYARNPCQDIASEVEAAAIDFGTKGTTVAISDIQGNIILLPVGRWYSEDELPDALMFENPTILKFNDTDRFMKAYGEDDGRPFTKFNDIAVSYPAQTDFEAVNPNKNMFQYLNQLKQWVNDPRRKPRILDGKGLVVPLRNYDGSGREDGIDPIEIYAYYIGLYINNRHRGKIYLEYLLSYSSTYLDKSCEQIRQSFEKGLKKSLPYEVRTNQELMKRFKVTLWCDEATAYVVCAIKRCLLEDSLRKEREQQYMDMLAADGIFYGVYDFGGGTLDFGFGKFVKSKEEEEPDQIIQWGVGGSPTLGCENILEELAFTIFNRNRDNLTRNKIRCNMPPQFGTLAAGNFIGNSNQARLNTWELITCLRELWMDGEKDINAMDSLPLVGEDGMTRQFTIKTPPKRSYGEEDDGQSDETPEEGEDSCCLLVEEGEIERFFQDKVREGVNLFFEKYEKVVRENAEVPPRKCLIFLAGNAGRSIRVRQCIDSYLERANMSQNFIIISPLPTSLDEKLSKENGVNAGGSIPNAKTGVVYGILLSRPGFGDIKIEMKQPGQGFLYHVGYRIQDLRYPMGLFRLSVSGDELPKEKGVFRKIRKIPQGTGGVFQLLYTNDQGYCVKGRDIPISQGVYIVQITVSNEHLGKFLYGRVMEGSVCRIELGVSSQDSEQEVPVEAVIGYCELAPDKSSFVPRSDYT